MKDEEIEEKIQYLQSLIWRQNKEIAEAKTEPPIIFEGDCKKCEKVTVHRSYFNLPPPTDTTPMASTTVMSYYVIRKDVIKVCLNCGLETLKGN